MSVGEFQLVNAGHLAIFNGTINLGSDAFYGVLTVDAGGAPSPAADVDYADLQARGEPGGVDYDQRVAAIAVSEPSPGVVMVDMAKVIFTAAGDIAARYFWVVRGNAAAPVGTDPIVGFMDLNDGGAGDVSSTGAEFSVDANANGLFRNQKQP